MIVFVDNYRLHRNIENKEMKSFCLFSCFFFLAEIRQLAVPIAPKPRLGVMPETKMVKVP